MGLFHVSASALATAANLVITDLGAWVALQAAFHLIPLALAGAFLGWVQAQGQWSELADSRARTTRSGACPNPTGSNDMGYRSLRPPSQQERTMPRYLCLQRRLPGAGAPEERPSPAQMQAMYAKFNEWREKFQKNLVDLGGRLGSGQVALPEPAPDGHLVEVKELVGGYMIVAAANLGEAVQVARECPGLVRPGSGVEVVEIHAPG